MKKKSASKGNFDEPKELAYFAKHRGEFLFACSRCGKVNRSTDGHETSLKCSNCRRKIKIPVSNIHPLSLLGPCIVINIDSVNDEYIKLSGRLISEGENVKIRIMSPKKMKSPVKVKQFLTEILDPVKDVDKIIRVGRDHNIVFQIRRDLDKYEYPSFIEFRKAFIAGSESVHSKFLKFSVEAFPNLSAKLFDFLSGEESDTIITDPVYRYNSKGIMLALSVEDKSKAPLMIIEQKYDLKANMERIKRTDRILAKYNSKINKVLLSFSDEKIPGWNIVNIKKYTQALIRVFDAEFSYRRPVDDLLVIFYLRYLNRYCTLINELQMAEKQLQKHLNNKMRLLKHEMLWKTYFSGARRDDFENFILREEKGVSSDDNPMMRNHIDMTMVDLRKTHHTSLWDTIWKSHDRSEKDRDALDPEEYPESTKYAILKKRGDIKEIVAFPELHNHLLECQRRIYTCGNYEFLKETIIVYFRTIANLAILQLIDIKTQKGNNKNSVDALLKSYKLPKEAEADKCIKCIQSVVKEVASSKYKKEGIRLKLPSLLSYDCNSRNVARLANFLNDTHPNGWSALRTYRTLLKELTKLPFLDYPVHKWERVMETPAGDLDISPIYSYRLGNYNNTNAFHSIRSSGISSDNFDDHLDVVEA